MVAIPVLPVNTVRYVVGAIVAALAIVPGAELLVGEICAQSDATMAV